VQAWQSGARITEALALGADVIASPSEWVYLNRPANELPLNRVARFDPAALAAPGGGASPRRGRLLGAEAPLWTEHVTSPTNAELMWWPRLLGFAEAVWHGPADTLEFAERVARVAATMRAEGVAVGPSDRALVTLRFAYDSASRAVRVGHGGIPGLRLALLAPGKEPREVQDGDPLPGTGTWQLVAAWGNARIGEPRTITVVDHLARGRSIRLATPADARYPGTGAHTLVDGVRGTAFNDGFWNGWWGPDLDVAIDLGNSRTIREVSISMLEQVGSWIAYPEVIELHRSDDGEQWRLLQRLETGREIAPEAASRHMFAFALPQGTAARWVRIVARGARILPGWHSGAGQPAWLFVDEVIVR
jgi:hexosaminidase